MTNLLFFPKYFTIIEISSSFLVGSAVKKTKSNQKCFYSYSTFYFYNVTLISAQILVLTDFFHLLEHHFFTISLSQL